MKDKNNQWIFFFFFLSKQSTTFKRGTLQADLIPVAYWATEEKIPQNLSHLKGSTNKSNPTKPFINYQMYIIILREISWESKMMCSSITKRMEVFPVSNRDGGYLGRDKVLLHTENKCFQLKRPVYLTLRAPKKFT